MLNAPAAAAHAAATAQHCTRVAAQLPRMGSLSWQLHLDVQRLLARLTLLAQAWTWRQLTALSGARAEAGEERSQARHGGAQTQGQGSCRAGAPRCVRPRSTRWLQGAMALLLLCQPFAALDSPSAPALACIGSTFTQLWFSAIPGAQAPCAPCKHQAFACRRRGPNGTKRYRGLPGKVVPSRPPGPELPSYGFPERLVQLRAEVLSLLSDGHKIDQGQARQVRAFFRAPPSQHGVLCTCFLSLQRMPGSAICCLG